MTQSMEWWEWAKFAVDVLAAIFTIAASGIAVWVFLFKRDDIRAFLKVVKNFVHQNSLAELRMKLEKLNDLNASDPQGRDEVIGIFHDICGQIDGSPMLRDKLGNLSARIRRATTGRRLITDPQKRSLVSELRESLRHLDVADYADAMKGISG